MCFFFRSEDGDVRRFMNLCINLANPVSNLSPCSVDPLVQDTLADKEVLMSEELRAALNQYLVMRKDWLGRRCAGMV